MVPKTIPRATHEAWSKRQKKRQRRRRKRPRRTKILSQKKAEAMLLKSNKKLGKPGTGKKVAMTKIHGHGSHSQKSPMR